jgi:Ca2+-binding EF-hand superfamily protein
VRANYVEVWERVRQAADANQDGKVSREEFVAYLERLPAIREAVAELARTILRLADRNGDGKISPAEYTALSQAYGVDAPAAAEAFGHLDRDGDGLIDTEELLQNVEEFFYGDDPNAPGTWLVGPL